MEPNHTWAVCPRPDDITSSNEPKTFKSEKDARRFLNSRVRFRTNKAIAAELGISVKEVRSQNAERERQRKARLRLLKAEDTHPLKFPLDLLVIRNRDQGWGNPIPIVSVPVGAKCNFRLFRDFYPVSDLNPVPPEDLRAIIERVFSGNMPDYTCLLSSHWRFEDITKDAARRVGYEFEGRRHGSIAEITLKAIYDLERSLLLFFPDTTCAALAKFWTSWNVQRHLAEFAHRVQKSRIAEQYSREPHVAARAARELMNVQLAVYVHEITATGVTDSDPAVTKNLQIRSDFAKARAEGKAHEQFLIQEKMRTLRVAEPSAVTLGVRAERIVAQQIEALRLECDLTQQKLSDELGIELRTVQRHLAGESVPHRRSLAAYERYFSNRLNRKIIIGNLS
jgi:DNA-binding transcriptional regulator YiaG